MIAYARPAVNSHDLLLSVIDDETTGNIKQQAVIELQAQRHSVWLNSGLRSGLNQCLCCAVQLDPHAPQAAGLVARLDLPEVRFIALPRVKPRSQDSGLICTQQAWRHDTPQAGDCCLAIVVSLPTTVSSPEGRIACSNVAQPRRPPTHEFRFCMESPLVFDGNIPDADPHPHPRLARAHIITNIKSQSFSKHQISEIFQNIHILEKYTLAQGLPQEDGLVEMRERNRVLLQENARLLETVDRLRRGAAAAQPLPVRDCGPIVRGRRF